MVAALAEFHHAARGPLSHRQGCRHSGGATHRASDALSRAERPVVAIAEANLNDYAGMYLTPASGKPGTFASALSPLPSDAKLKVRGRAATSRPGASSWSAKRPAG